MMPFDIDGYETHVRCNEMIAAEIGRHTGADAEFWRDILRARIADRERYERSESTRWKILAAVLAIGAGGYVLAGVARLLAAF
jgi:hypothetical protein